MNKEVFMFKKCCMICFLGYTASKTFYIDPFEKELRTYFSKMIQEFDKNLKNVSSDFFIEKDFPDNTEINPCQININRNDPHFLIIELETKRKIEEDNIKSQKHDQFIKIQITADGLQYHIILQENKLFITTEYSKRLKNESNTKYSSTSSHMSRQEILDKPIILDSLKMTVIKDIGKISIAIKYAESTKGEKQGIDIEYK